MEPTPAMNSPQDRPCRATKWRRGLQ